MSKTILLLGSNIENREVYLHRALEYLSLKIGHIIQCSDIYESEPWGFDTNTDFLNQAVIIETMLNPFELLKELLNIEYLLGRRRVKDHQNYVPRIIDIDIIFYDNFIINTKNLIIPHPFFTQRKFAIIPVYSIAPFFIHPLLNKNVKTILTECNDNSKVTLHKKYVNNIKSCII
ncbi:MAG TPA: 2-amino-4-hydroxy-6-hydroxymethyldihydropteridine diphosphokinase [Bacteroidales bacterium]|nr:2-amino-4-hydroxy-6-hydroxymethyldihydropteridine diphosphokinase [Bacteroidales bacterium]